jgi:mannose-6-phosphate isomerase-like protein (cupin superfamily)
MSERDGGTHVGPGAGRTLRVLSSELEVKAGAETGLGFGMFRSSFPPGAGMPFLHVHRGYDEAFYVIEGQVRFQLGMREIHTGAGSAVLVPAGVPHCFVNTGTGNVDSIVVTAPAVAVTLVEEVGAVPAGDLDRLAELFERHDSQLLERRPTGRAEADHTGAVPRA